MVLHRVADGKSVHLAVFPSEYADPSMKLGYANDDGDALVEAFKRQQGRLFEDVIVERLRDADATVEGIEHAIDRIADRARPADVFVMFASGHGGMVKCPGEAKAGYRLVTHRATLRSKRLLCAEALSLDRLTEKLRSIHANKKLLILDTCQAGGAATGAACAGPAQEPVAPPPPPAPKPPEPKVAGVPEFVLQAGHALPVTSVARQNRAVNQTQARSTRPITPSSDPRRLPGTSIRYQLEK